MLIWIASYPRSGNTWFRAVLHTLGGYGSWAIYPTAPSASPWALGQISLTPDLTRELVASPELSWVKTHERAGADDHPAVYLVRDGRDALVSYTWYTLQHERRLPDPIDPALFRQTMRNLIVGPSPFGTWSENVASWVKRPDTVVVHFERLIGDPVGELRRAAEALRLTALPFHTDAPLPTFASLHARTPSFFRRGDVGQWKTDMPADLQTLFRKHHGPMMRELGYD